MKNPTAMSPKGRTGGRDLLKGHDVRYIYSRLWKYISHYKFLFLLAILLTIASSILSITGTSLAGSAIGAIAKENTEYTLGFYLLMMIILYTVSAIISYLLSVLMVRISQKIVNKMRTDVYDRLVKLPASFFDKKQAGELVSTISYDINTVNESLSTDFIDIISSTVTIIYSFVLMLTVSWQLIFVFVLTIPVSVIFTKIISGIVRPLFRRRSAKLGEMNGYIEEMIAGHKVIKAYGREEEVIEAFNKKNAEASEAYRSADANGTMAPPCVAFINNLSLTLVNVVGALLNMLGGTLSIGGLSKFVLLSRKFSGPINQISNVYADIQSALAASERVFRLIDEPAEPSDIEGAQPLSVTAGEVKFEHVSFGYDESRLILKDVSFTASPASVTAIVGPTGAGKTTIINLLMRFYDINSGRILIDGKDIYSVTRDSLRRAYTMVLQETWLFRGTIRENLAYGRENVTEEEILNACRAAHIHNYIMSLPDGYNTVISERGGNISKGQKQLLTIARAMLIDSNMLILDEATSNVDSKTEKDISDAMINLMKNKTCFVIAHRLSTVKNADRILVVNEGNIVEQGTHEQLLKRGGFYSELYYSQFDTPQTACR